MKNLVIEVSEELKQAWPQFRGAAVFATVKILPIMRNCGNVLTSLLCYTVLNIPPTPSKKCRPFRQPGRLIKMWKRSQSLSSFFRSLVSPYIERYSLYQIDTLVDLINLASIYSGHSIGGFDLDKIQGDRLVLGIGKAGEPYEGIGRGELNIEGMPVYRDAVGGVGTPTSDNERTKISEGTTHLLAIMNGYSGSEGLEENVTYMVDLLKEFAEAQEVKIVYFE